MTEIYRQGKCCRSFVALTMMIALVATGAPAASQESPSSESAAEAATAPEADQAYVPPAQDEPPLPALPATPVLDTSSYPDCREDHQKIAMPFDRAEDTNRCTLLLDQYYAEVLTPFREKMIAHQNALSALYTNQVGGKMQYSQASQDSFYKKMMEEHARSDPDGENLAGYRAAEKRYQDDRAYLQDRFCFNTGCGGYPVPAIMVAEAAEDQSGDADKKKRKKKKTAAKSSRNQKCKKSRKRGGFLGGVLGGVVGDAAGLGTVGTIISSGFGAVLVGEIACKLTDKEQKKAAEATVEVTEKEEVGATAEWKSPTRSGVSGSSTVTALNTEPSGRRCMNITDVAIIDGEETRVSKQMCRGPGESRYSIV
ncbi:Surface antigen [Parasphingorhabdus marina DSM 22363]|uniref:Surface antigen n=1 Tax=Parasphingorhabdus marina DSM 22363 TaxID=1123272 RepID=A0A1N6H233_9SPHN|nr:hypothetical protein [Parasphingorhabdus marina]SIO13819.1 Surface antigen [Parasphingorhabdus marina DSM 22363]